VHGSSIVQDLVLLYALALVLLLIGGRLRAPAIVSLIATGVIAGPGGLGLVGSEETVTTLSEIGIALLLFMVGLDLSFGEVRRMWRRVVVGGSAQVLGTMAVTAPIAYLLLGSRLETILFVGFFVAISNTSIIVRELTRRNEIHAPHGGLAVGILLLQDLLALVALVLAPVLFGSSDAPSLGRALLQIAVIALALAGATRFLLPLLFRLATVSGREAFGLMVLVASLGTAWLASVLGLSMTVGAFLAGLVIDESEFSHQIHAEIRPLRDLLTSLFFISVGLLVQPATLAPVFHWVIGVALAIVVVKTVGATVALRLARVPRRVAATTALGLAQVGEFSFVLGSSALANGAIDPSRWQVLLAASVLTMMATPWLVGLAPAFGGWLARTQEDGEAAEAARREDLAGHVLILGFGVGGRLIAWALRGVQTPHVILELDGVAVREAAAQGHHILYGDATAAEPLRAAGVARAAAVVAVLSDPGASERAVRAVRALNRHVPVIVRTRYRAEAERMIRAGASRAVAEELEASLEVMAELLVRLGVPGNVAEELVGDARRSMASSTARSVSAPAAPSDQVAGLLGATPVSSYQLAARDWAVGQSLAAVNLRAETGATILAVKRAGATLAPPPVDLVFASGDVLYVVGDEASVRDARTRLGAGGTGAGRADQSPKSMESV
jgi:CPA2 family monovalent cation:H+ antiporter-2